MNKEIAELWIAALRSGEYKQGRNFLRRVDNSFCCLGVLCDLHSKITGEGTWISLYGKQHYKSENFHQHLRPPKPVIDWAGLKELDPFISARVDKCSLTCLNDHHEQSFDQIADEIENNWEDM